MWPATVPTCRFSMSGRASDTQLSLGSLLGVVAPLLQQFILEGKAGEDSGHEIKQVDRDREANVTDAAIQTLGALAAQLPWVQYEQLLNQWMKAMKKKGGKVSLLNLTNQCTHFLQFDSTHGF